jgi:NAD(P) transhydrogenase
MAAKYDLVVLGAGPAGEKGAAQAAYFGKRVAVVDPNPRPGGIAVSTAGIPTKTLREGAIYLCGLGQSATGVPPASARDSWRLLMARKLEVSEFMTKAVERNLVRHGIERIRGRARFLPDRRVEVEKAGEERVVLEADVVLLASGSRPRHPPGIPMDDPDVHDSESILEIEAAPESILVIGGGSLGCEYASIFAGLGVQVTVVDAGSHLLPALDVEMARVLAESFNSMGIRVVPMVSVSGVARESGALEARLVDGRTLRAQKILVAAGRRPQIDGLGLAEAGVEIDERGWVRVDDAMRPPPRGLAAATCSVVPGWRRSRWSRPASRCAALASPTRPRAMGLALVRLLDPRGRVRRYHRGGRVGRGPRLRPVGRRSLRTRRRHRLSRGPDKLISRP